MKYLALPEHNTSIRDGKHISFHNASLEYHGTWGNEPHLSAQRLSREDVLAEASLSPHPLLS